MATPTFDFTTYEEASEVLSRWQEWNGYPIGCALELRMAGVKPEHIEWLDAYLEAYENLEE